MVEKMAHFGLSAVIIIDFRVGGFHFCIYSVQDCGSYFVWRCHCTCQSCQCLMILILGLHLMSLQLYYSPMRDEAAAQNLLTDPEKQAFFLMTNLRMVLVKFRTSSLFDPSTITTSLKRSFFFTVSDWDVLAACFCNGQASQCDPNVRWFYYRKEYYQGS